ncbi:MAG: hypothetical protein V4439_01255 [Patescibacteria group bacterium]
MNKIIILGCPSSGKTILANKLGSLLHLPVHHLDKIFWTQEGHIEQDSFIAQQQEMMNGDKWILDGNFIKSKSYDIRLSNADTIIFFAFSKAIIYWRLIKRSIKYFKKLRPDMGGNRKNHFNWELLKLIWNYPTKEEYKIISEFSENKKVIILHNVKEESLFLKKLRFTQ